MTFILVIGMLLDPAKCMNTSKTSSNAIWNNSMTKHMENNKMEKRMSPAGRVARKGVHQIVLSVCQEGGAKLDSPS